MPFPFGGSLPTEGDILPSVRNTVARFVYTVKFDLIDPDTGRVRESRFVKMGFDGLESADDVMESFLDIHQADFEAIYNLDVGNVTVVGKVVEGKQFRTS